MLQTVRILTGVEPASTPDSTFWIRSRWYGDNDGAALFIESELERLGYTTSVQDFLQGTVRGTNVIASRPGTVDPQTSVMICAHYDAVSGTPGADDNASGTAAVIEAARVMAMVDTERTVEFALWDAEEIGLFGSAYYAQAAAAAGSQIEAVINLDMIAWDADNDRVIEIHSNAPSSSLAANMVSYAKTYTGGLSTIVYEPGTGASDHRSFWQNGYEAVLLIEEYYGGDFNTYYHSAADSMGYFNTQFFRDAAALGIAGLAELAVIDGTSTGYVGPAGDTATLDLRTFPMPFATSVTISFNTSSPSPVFLAAYDVMGRQVAILTDDWRAPGRHEVRWTPAGLSAGVYLLVIQTNSERQVRPVVVTD